VTFLERAENPTLDVAAEILGLSAASLSHNTRSEISLPKRFGGMGMGDLVALAYAAHVVAAGLAVGFAIRFLHRKTLVCVGIPAKMFRGSRPCMGG
jgi:hypothetical protein